ncbi:MAG: MBL fold metallo-hydrolase [Desulfuromonadales bacterium]|nr:MBL fold metallo-hydrolase [Desulfuromonadales bacterium]
MLETDFTILHHGGATGVTGSCHELRLANGRGLLVDCGLYQGEDADRPLTIDFPVEKLLGLVLTHVHLDHVGRLPWLLAAGFRGPIYCSEASAALLPTVLQDAVAVGLTRDRELIERFLRVVEKRLRPLAYGAWQQIATAGGQQLAIRLQPAGHILGSAYVQCKLYSDRPGRNCQVLFSGDLGAPYTPLLPAPRSPYGADLVVLEATYGDRRHQRRAERRRGLQQAIEHALRDGGAVLVPAFSIGRTQELLYELEEIIHRQRQQPSAALDWSRLAIVLDSPLASRFTALYRQLQRFWDAEAHVRLREGRRPLAFDQLLTIDSHQDHQRLVDSLRGANRPCVVIAASGMCSGGRIVNYLKALLGDARTDVLFTGYQAVGTPGRAIQQYGPRGGYVVLDGERYPIRATIRTLPGYSAHADQRDLVNFIKRMRKRPTRIHLVHGEIEARTALRRELLQVEGVTEVV